MMAAIRGIDPRGAMLPSAILLLVLLMVVPVPAVLLDLFFILNIGISLIVLMVAINTRKPLDFSAFPTVLLFATLLRLALNVASTRVVLVHGHEGTAAAGHVIEAFGAFLVGGDYVVGIFVFAVLMIINLVVITKGAGRVSEVAARFTLDALPGKQMAIDADLNAGLLTADEARKRRLEVTTEADFHGAMDGASKFVKGDAVAGVLILAINIIGGLILGAVQHGLSIGEAARIYLLLAVGDGLVAQVPALLLSIAAAMVVTRVGSELDLAGQVSSQFAQSASWAPVAVILALLALLPGSAAPGHPRCSRRGRVDRLEIAETRHCTRHRDATAGGNDRMGRGLRRGARQPRHRFRPGAVGRRGARRAADGADHRHPAAIVEAAWLRAAAGAGPRRPGAGAVRLSYRHRWGDGW